MIGIGDCDPLQLSPHDLRACRESPVLRGLTSFEGPQRVKSVYLQLCSEDYFRLKQAGNNVVVYKKATQFYGLIKVRK